MEKGESKKKENRYLLSSFCALAHSFFPFVPKCTRKTRNERNIFIKINRSLCQRRGESEREGANALSLFGGAHIIQLDRAKNLRNFRVGR